MLNDIYTYIYIFLKNLRNADPWCIKINRQISEHCFLLIAKYIQRRKPRHHLQWCLQVPQAQTSIVLSQKGKMPFSMEAPHS